MDPWEQQVLDPVGRVLDRWAADGNQAALEILLPSWRAINGLTDSWFDAVAALRSVAQHDGVDETDAAVLLAVADLVQRRLEDR